MVSHNGCKLLRGKLWKTCKTAYFSRLMTPLKCFTMFHCCSSIYFTHCGKITFFVKKFQFLNFQPQNLNFRTKNERKLSQIEKLIFWTKSWILPQCVVQNGFMLSLPCPRERILPPTWCVFAFLVCRVFCTTNDNDHFFNFFRYSISRATK